MRLREIIKKKIYESVGVPSGINITAEQIYNDILRKLQSYFSDDSKIIELNNFKFILGEPYKFSDHIINGIKIIFELEDESEYEFTGMYVQHDVDVEIPKIKYKRGKNLIMGIRFEAPLDDEIKNFIKFFILKKSLIISSIAHEIMHDYDNTKNPYKRIESSIDYVSSKVGFSDIYYLNQVIIGNYFLHSIENSVRPSEVYTNLLQLGATKKDFKEKLNKANFMKILNSFKDLSYDGLIEQLRENYDKVLYILRDNDFEVDDNKIDENIQFFLHSLRTFLLSKYIDLSKSIVRQGSKINDVIKQMMGYDDASDIFFKKYIKTLTNNFEYIEQHFEIEKSSELNKQFFTNRINKLVDSSKKIYRKLAKIYSILPEDSEKQTLNKKINMKTTKNNEVFEKKSWDNPDVLFNKKYPHNLKETKIDFLNSLINEEKKYSEKTFVLNEMKKIGIEKLPYAYSALKPFIDSKTMNIHYNKHYKGYVDKLNKALSNLKSGDAELEDIIKSISKYNTEIRNNSGGAFNHALFWNMLSPKKTTPSKELKEKIIKDFGTFQKFKNKFEEVAKSRFGSGWAWLVITKNKKLKVVSTPNQDNPLMNVVKDGGFPLLGLDLWEHAYYLKYQNKRDEYISNFWNVVNWNFVSKMYEIKTKTNLTD